MAQPSGVNRRGIDSLAPARSLACRLPWPALFPALIALLLVAATSPGAARANPFDTFGLGSRSAALANAVTAVADDFSASLYNPAGLVDAGQMELSVGYFHALPDLETFWAGAWRDVEEDTTSGLVFGVVFPPFKIFGRAFVGGLGMHLPDKRISRSLILPYDQPRFLMYGGRNQRTVIYFPNALEITPWLSVGAGVQLFLDTTGGPDFVLVEAIPRNEGRFSEGSISSAQKPRFFPFAGVLVKPVKGLRIGFGFRDKQEVTLDVPLIVNVEPLTLGFSPVPLLPASTIDLNTPASIFFSPRQYALGISWQATPRLLLAADLSYQEWSSHRNPSPEGRGFYTGGLAILLRQPPVFVLPQGGLRNIWVPAVGVEVRCLDHRYVKLDLRGGYRFRPSPVPEQTGRTAFLDSDTHIISGGVGFTFTNVIRRIMTEPFSVDVHVQYVHMMQRDYVRNLLVAGGDRFGDIRFRGRVLSLGITTTFRF